MASYRIQEIEGIGGVYGKKLEACGVSTTAQLLKAAAAPKGRKALAEQSGLAEAQILKWANLADLMRIRGIGKQYSELLEAAGVDTVKELKHRNAANLAKAMADKNAQKKLTRAVPAEKMVAGWIEQAKIMEPVLTY